MDWVAVTIAGAAEEVSECLFRCTQNMGETGTATLLGMPAKTTPPFAALINGTASHALDYDDVYLQRPGHPSAPVIPAILAIAEWKGFSGKDFIEALVVGIQAEYAIGEGVLPEHYDQGWHNTGTLGHFGSASGVSKLLHLPPQKIINAIGIAATQAAGLRVMFGTMCKPLHAGKAAMNGLLAGLWACEGMNSSADSLDGDIGFLNVYSSKASHEKMKESLSEDYHILKIRFKDYPSCRGSHTVIDGILDVKAQYRIEAETISEIHLASYHEH